MKQLVGLKGFRCTSFVTILGASLLTSNVQRFRPKLFFQQISPFTICEVLRSQIIEFHLIHQNNNLFWRLSGADNFTTHTIIGVR